MKSRTTFNEPLAIKSRSMLTQCRGTSTSQKECTGVLAPSTTSNLLYWQADDLPLEDAKKINRYNIAGDDCRDEVEDTPELQDSEYSVVECETGRKVNCLSRHMRSRTTDMEYLAKVVLVWYIGSNT